ncbi:MAG: C1 family peptidase [Elusimicrobia bacterium]|nr:C1 family peptidase [Elusimicrobiota bacterium]
MKINFLLTALAVVAFGSGAGAQDVSFDSLYNGMAIKAAPVTEPAAAPAATLKTSTAVPVKPEKANPEFSYEKLITAPVWKFTRPDPASVDLRDGFSAAKHQGSRNVCNVFAALGLAEYLVWKNEGAKPDFSEEFLYYNAKLNFTGKPELEAYKKEPGLAGYVAVDALRGGVVAENEWPFKASLPAHDPVPPLTDPDVGTPPRGIEGKILDYRFSPLAVRRTEIKEFIIKEQRPVVMNLMIYMENIDNASGRISDPSGDQRAKCFASGDNCGGHVVLLTGYDQDAKEFIFRNSWGAKWGEGGFGRISEKYLMENCEGCHYLDKLDSMSAASRSMEVNSAYGWSASLK